MNSAISAAIATANPRLPCNLQDAALARYVATVHAGPGTEAAAAAMTRGCRDRRRQADADTQGGRDYQVTVEDDLVRWRAGLAGKSGVTMLVYAKDNYLFLPGTGASTPADYDGPQHVDSAEAADIADWLTARR